MSRQSYIMKTLPWLALLSLNTLTLPEVAGQAIPVSIRDEGDGQYTIVRGDNPYWIKGGGTGNIARFAELEARGGNSVRTWGTDNGTRELLDSAYAHGLSVMLGLWIGRESDGFDYNNETAVSDQLDKFRLTVLAYKDHPALLAWGIGNEANLGYSNLNVWDAVNDISEMIHEVDGNHPTLTVTADISSDLANALAVRAPDLDLLGVNSYGGIAGVPVTIRNSDWNKPYVITEWGINGPWEVSHTSWNAPVEPNSSEKSSTFRNRYKNVILANPGKLLGSYAFLWNSKTEGTLTWFGLFVKDETTEMIDVLQYEWTGSWASDLAPRIVKVAISDRQEQNSYILTSSSGNRVEVLAEDPDGDSLRYEFLIRPETGEQGLGTIPGATFMGIPGIITNIDGNSADLVFGNAENNRNYRLYIFVRDGQGHVGTANLPLRTQLVDLEPEFEFTPVGDAFVRNGIHADTRFGKTNPKQLHVKYSMTADSVTETYLMFDLTYAPGSIGSAWLELFGGGQVPVEVEVRAISGYQWDEKELTWNNRTVPASDPVASAWTQSSDEEWISWDVKDGIEEAFSRDERNITFVLSGNAVYAGGPLVFNSKESDDNPPRLKFDSNPAGIISTLDEEIKIIPNPAGNRITTYLPESWSGRYDLQFYTSSGRLAGQYEASGNPFTLSVKDLPDGVYILRIICRDAQRSITTKFIKTSGE